MLSNSPMTKYTILFMGVACCTILFGGLLTFWYKIGIIVLAVILASVNAYCFRSEYLFLAAVFLLILVCSLST